MNTMPIQPKKALLRAISTCMLMAFLFFSIAAYPHERSFPCGSAKDLMKKSMGGGYAYLATAVADPGIVLQFYLNVKTGDWLEIGIDEKQNACVLLHGYDWQFAMIKGL